MNGSTSDVRSRRQPRIEAATVKPTDGRMAHALREFSGLPERLELLPAKGPRPEIPLYTTAEVPVRLPAQLAAGLEALAHRLRLPLLVPLLAGWAALLARWSGQDDLLVGVTVPSRLRPDAEPTDGRLGRSVGVRFRLHEDPTVKRFLKDVRTSVRKSTSYQDRGFEQMAEDLRRSGVPIPPLQVVVKLNSPLELPAVVETPRQSAFELILSLEESADGLAGTLEYASELFERETVERLLAGWEVLLGELITDIFQPVSRLPIMCEAEKRRVLVEFNETATPYPKHKLIHQLFEEQVERTPDAVAVEHEGRQLTYAKLNRRANQLARYLVSQGVGPDQIVGICVERGLEMVVGLLAILKAGGAYLPLDPSYPGERLAYMLEDASPQVLLTQESARPCLPPTGVGIVCIDGDWNRVSVQSSENLSGSHGRPSASNLAYVIYTSGSTGKPKGVGIEHRNAVNLICWAQSSGDPKQWRRALQSTSLNFDLSVYECFVPLSVGGCVCIVENALSLNRISTPITLINTVPSAIGGLLDTRAVPNATRVVNLGGEVIQEEVVRRIFACSAVDVVWNLYGPTETTVYSTALPMSRESGFIPAIGRPIDNTRIYILDRRLQLVPIGVTGEIYIGGAGVARGYHNRPALTAQRFLADPFELRGLARMYKTGDFGRWRADGMIEYLGRNDQQVKIRGYRIELGEIEAQLKRHGPLKEAVVLAREDTPGDKRLVAYLVPQDPAAVPLAEDLRDGLRSSLPEYMVPSAFVVLERLPLTENGKLDRGALPVPDSSAFVGRPYEAPQGVVEETLAGIWQDVLRLRRIGRNDNFFELGGHSLLMVQLMEQVRQAGYAIEPGDAFGSRSLADLARGLTAQPHAAEETPSNLIPADCTAITPQMLSLIELEPSHIDRIAQSVPGGCANIKDIYPLAPLQEGVLFHHLLDERQADPYVLVLLFSLPSEEGAQSFIRALQAVIDRHDALRTAVLWDRLPRPAQVVYRRARLPVERIALDPERDLREELKERMKPEHQRLTLQQAPLMRLQIIADGTGVDRHAILQLHHIVCDHEALETMLAETTAMLEGRMREMTEPTAYRNVVAQALADSRKRDAVAFFRGRLGGVTEPTAPFGLADVRGDGKALEIASEVLGSQLVVRVKSQARRLGVSVATLFHVIWALVVAGVSGRDEAVYGTVLSGRLKDRAGTQPAIGMLINTLPLRVELHGLTVKDLVDRTHRELVALLDHAQASLAVAQRCSGLDGSTPLFSALLNCVRSAPAARTTGNDSDPGFELLDLKEWTNYPITLTVDDQGDSVVLTAQTDRRVDPHRILGYVRTATESLCEALERAPETAALALDYLPGSERQQLIESFNSTTAGCEDERLAHELFEDRTRRAPDGLAVECGARRLTYAQLNARANQVARALIARGVRPDGRVGLCIPRGTDLVIGMLGTLKAGGAYVPLDPTYPAGRLQHMMKSSDPVVLLADRNVVCTLPSHGAPILFLDEAGIDRESTADLEPARVGVRANHLAYVIYTSGSTGMPKGVMVEHGSLVNLINWHCEAFDVRPGSRCSCAASVGFDAATWEVWPPLIAGGTLCIAPQALSRDPQALLAWWAEQSLDVSFLTTPVAELALAAGMHSRGLRTLLVGGDRLRQHPGRRPFRVINNYGPTESTVVATSGAIAVDDPVLHIGRPIANGRVYILDRHLRPAPVGATGEIYVGGRGVARGYLDRPELTAERFLADPFSSDARARMYRTGDLARWRADGSIEFLGRNDDQVKIRGFRIELGEIEAQLARCEAVREAVVLAREDTPGEKRLVAYVIPREQSTVAVVEVREALRTVLPEYMMPAAFVVLEKLPLTANGKVDRRALPKPDTEAKADSPYEPPAGEIEEAVAGIWRQLLPVEHVGRNDHFFELGGHSLLATQMVLRVRDALLIGVSMRDVFDHPTLRRFAARLDDLRREELLVQLAAGGQAVESLLERLASLPETEARECLLKFNTGVSR